MMKKVLMVIVLLTLALVGYKLLLPKNVTINSTTNSTLSTSSDSSGVDLTIPDFDDIPPTYVDTDSPSESDQSSNSVLNAPTAPATPSFSCDGRQHCSQMTSCAEATYFNNNCPNTKMDGNNDGTPCEQQWCR